MTIPVEVLAQEVLRLPSGDRRNLLDRIVASLDADQAREHAWDELAATRDADIEGGRAAPITGDDPIARLRAELV